MANRGDGQIQVTGASMDNRDSLSQVLHAVFSDDGEHQFAATRQGFGRAYLSLRSNCRSYSVAHAGQRLCEKMTSECLDMYVSTCSQ